MDSTTDDSWNLDDFLLSDITLPASLNVDCTNEDGKLATLPTPLTPSDIELCDSNGHSILEYGLEDLSALSISGPSIPHSDNKIPPKVGARFSKEVNRTLKNWLAFHHHHPYPTNEELETLKFQTGLNQTQITNWFANARRRGKIQSSHPSASKQSTSTKPLNIVPRPGTPISRQDPHHLNPLERWIDSPPENEPATVSAIARAVASSHGIASYRDSPHTFSDTQNDSPWRSPCNVSFTSSGGTSHSSEFSAASSHSHTSGSFQSPRLSRLSRKKRNRKHRRAEKTPLANGLTPFKCTFCTEAFKTKHDWERHEKSLHIPLERWVCAPFGSRTVGLDASQLCCVFCGGVEPNEAHAEIHNFSLCNRRTLEQRTFNRKDHLSQHLRLVHNVRFADWSMNNWKVSTPDIRSRCGFCGIWMDTWKERSEHLAEHFKAGKTMSDWQGDWGFEDAVLRIIENAIPPYIIGHELHSPFPFEASSAPPESPPNAYELIKVELEFYMRSHYYQTEKMPSNSDMQVEACRIIFASEVSPEERLLPRSSWLRDLIMSSHDLTERARFGPVRSRGESKLSVLKIIGKDDLFESCPLEAQLHGFVEAQKAIGILASDEKLQEEARRIIECFEKASRTPFDIYANWLVKLVYSNTNWLSNFRKRACIPLTAETLPTCSGNSNHVQPLPMVSPLGLRSGHYSCIAKPPLFNHIPASHAEEAFTSSQAMNTISTGPRGMYAHNNANFHRWLARDLQRWATVTMSPSNPNCHVPSDEELQHQARWIMYDDDDPWNQTMADNTEWLQRFKRSAGILKDPGPGLWDSL